MSGYDTFQSGTKPWRVSVCTSANAINVQGFIDELPGKFPDLGLDVQYYELPYNDIDHFGFKGSDVNIMILCHSINNRRFAITDVMDALYDKFLPNSAKILGKARICVIVHDFPSNKDLRAPDRYKAEMETFGSMQGTTFKHSSLAMMCGKLDGPVEMQETNWEDLKEFLVKAATTPIPSKPPLDFCRKQWLAILVVLAIVAVTVGLGVGLGKSSPSATTTPTLPRSTPTVATTPTTISPKEPTQPPTTVPTLGTDTPPNPTTVPTTGTDTPPNPTTVPTTGTDTPPNPTTVLTTGTDTPPNPTTVPTPGTDTPPNPTTVPTTGTDTPPNPTTVLTTGTDNPPNPTTVPTTGTDTPPNPTTVPTTGTDTQPNPTAANKSSRARG